MNGKQMRVRGECLDKKWPKWLPYIGPRWSFVRRYDSPFWAGRDEEELGQYDYEWARKFYVAEWFGAGICFLQSKKTVYVGSRNVEDVYHEIMSRLEIDNG